MRYTKFVDKYEVPKAVSQVGIAEAVSASQDHISYAMKELRKRDLVHERLAHVHGFKRRRKAYFLTQKGYLEAEALRDKLKNVKVLVRSETGKLRELKLIAAVQTVNVPLVNLINYANDHEVIDAAELKRESGIEDPDQEQKKELIDLTDKAPKLKYFYGRESELDKLREWIDSDEYKLIVLQGIAGIGKTTLAVRILEDYRDKKHLFWYRFHRWDTIRNTIASIAQFLEKVGCKRLKSHLASTRGLDLKEISKVLEDELDGANILMVFDDFQRATENILQLFHLFVEVLDHIDSVAIIVVGRQILPFYDRKEVVIKHLVAEEQIGGLDEKSSRRLLKIEDINDEQFANIYQLTQGHPLFLELINNISDIQEMRDIKRYIHQEIFSKLKNEERRLLSCMSVFRYPVNSNAFFIAEDIEYTTIDQLVERSLLQEISYERYDVHDFIRDFFYTRLTPQLRARYHRAAAQYYMEQGSDRGKIEAQYHYAKAGDCEKAAKLAINSGRTLIAKGKLEEFRSVLKDFKLNTIPNTYRCEILALMADIETIMGHWDEALARYKDAIEVAAQTGDELVRAEAHRKLGHIYRRRGNKDDARENFETSLRISQRINDQEGIADTYRGLGMIYGGRGEFDAAIKHYNKSIEYAKSIEDRIALAKTYIDLGTAYGNKGEHDRAIEYHEKSIAILEDEGDNYELARVYNQLGVTYADKGEYERALDHYDRCIELSERVGDIRQVGYGLENAAVIFIKQKKLGRAVEYLDGALEIFIKLGERFMIAKAYHHYGNIFAARKEWMKAETNFNRALDILNDLNIQYYIAEVAYDFAGMYLAMKRRARARHYIAMARNIWEKLGSKQRLLGAEKALAQLG